VKRWWLVIALLLSVGLNLGILAAIMAARRQGPREPRPGVEMPNPGNDPLPRLPRLADRLGLEGEERRKFLEIQWNLYQESTRLRLQLGEVHRELRRELSGDHPDPAQVERLLNESARIYLALERALVRNVLATRDLLGPEKEREYLQMIGRLRVPGPGGFAGGPQRPALEEMDPRLRQRLLEQRLRQQRLRQQRFRERFENRFPEEETPP
jgi:hypothetical protein